MNIKEIKDLVAAVCIAVGKPINDDAFEIVYQPKKHTPKKLEKDKMAVYSFFYNGAFLKIGQANYKSPARYQSHHYHTKSGKSTLANSIIKDDSFCKANNIEEDKITQWIKDNCERYDIIFDYSLGKMLLDCIEGAMHYKYLPRYEGKE